MEQDDPKRGFPVPLHDVVNTLLRHNLDHDLSWWLAHLDRKVWELEQQVKKLEQQVKKLEKGDVIDDR